MKSRFEDAVLGAIVLYPEMFDDICDIVEPRHFASSVNQQIYDTIKKRLERNESVDILSLEQALPKIEPDYYYRLTDACASPSLLRKHASSMVADWRHSRMLFALASAAKEPYHGDIEGWVAKVLTEIHAADQDDSTGDNVKPISEILSEVDVEIERRMNGKRSCITLPWLSFNRRLYFEPGNLCVIAGRPGMGKTAWLCQELLHLSLHEKPCLLFSMEMTRIELVFRLLSILSLGAYTNTKLQSMLLDTEGWSRLDKARSILMKADFHIDDQFASNPSVMRMRTRRLSNRLNRSGKKLAAIGIDYLQLCSNSDDRKKSKEETISDYSRESKGLAKDFKCVVFLLSQLNRECEKRDNKRPVKSDIRGSGSVEQDADKIVFLYRPSEYGIEGPDEFIISKQRNGPTGTTLVRFLPEQQIFIES